MSAKVTFSGSRWSQSLSLTLLSLSALLIAAGCGGSAKDPGALFGVVQLTGAPTNENAVLTVSGRSLTTGADGSYTFEYLAAGDYTLRAAAEGYAPQEQPVTITPHQRVEANFTLVKGNSAPRISSLTVGAQPTAPLAVSEAVVVASDTPGEALTYTWSADQGFTVTPNAADPTHASITAPDLNGAAGTVSVVVTDPAGATVTGTVSVSTKVNRTPVISALTASPGVVVVGGTVTVTATASDPDGDAITYAWTLPTGWTSTGSGNLLTVTAPQLAGQSGTIDLVVTDSRGAKTTGHVAVATTANGAPQITAFDATPAQTAPSTAVFLSVSATDPNGDLLTYSWTAPAGWTFVTPPTGPSASLTAPATYGDVGQVSVTVTDPGGLSATAVAVVSTKGNRKPVLTALKATPATIAKGGTVVLNATVADPDGDALTYTWTAPSGWTVVALSDGGSPNGPQLSAVGPNTPGVSGTFTVLVSDGSGGTATGQVVVSTQSNSGPLITAIDAVPPVVAKSGTSALTVTATDPDNDPLTYTWTATSNWTVTPTGDGHTANVQAPALAGDVGTITVTATDTSGGTATTSVIVSTQDNRAPLLTDFTATPANVPHGGSIALAATATDADGDTLTYTYSSSDPINWPVSGTTAAESVVAPNLFGSTATITVTVTDGFGGSSSGSVVVSTDANQYPVINVFTAFPAVAAVGGSVNLDVSASDADGDPLTYSYSSSDPINWPVSGSSAQVTLTAPALPASSATITVTVSDGINSATGSVVVSTDVNHAPNISSFTANPVPANHGESVYLNVAASDPDGEPLTYSYVSSDPVNWPVSGTSSGMFISAAPVPNSSATITVTVTDPGGLTDFSTLVVSTRSNSAPQVWSLSGSPNPAIRGHDLTLSGFAIDPENDAINYAWSVSDPAWGLVVYPWDPTHPTLHTPSTGATSATVTLTVSDAFGQSSSTLVVSTVANQPPQITYVSTSSEAYPGSQINAYVYANDPDGDPLTYTWSVSDPAWQLNVGGNSVNVNAPFANAATATLTVDVSDGFGNSVQAHFQLKTSTCAGTTMNCNRWGGDACEADLAADNNCGACGNYCQQGDFCQAATACKPKTTHFRVTSGGATSLGVPTQLTVVALDANENVVWDYQGTLHFTSSLAADLPADQLIYPWYGGQFGYQVTGQANGVLTVTVNDVDRPYLTGSGTVFITDGVGTDTNPATSCRQVLSTQPTAPSGTYTLENTRQGRYTTQCDMTLDGGGWTLFFGHHNGTPSYLYQFEWADYNNCSDPQNCERRLPLGLGTDSEIAATCGQAAVRFNPNSDLLKFFQNGTTSNWVPTQNATSIGSVPVDVAIASQFYTGGNTYGWMLSENVVDTSRTFASSRYYDYWGGPSYNFCNGQPDTTSPVRLMYRERPADHFKVAFRLARENPGVSGIVTVTALTSGGTIDASYLGTVHFTSSDTGSGVVLPADFTFLRSDEGTHTFNVTLITLGVQSVTATELPGSLTGAGSIDISNGLGTLTNPVVSCETLYESENPAPPSGVYAINPEGTTYPAHCDMTTAGGGWTTFFASTNGTSNTVANFDFASEDCTEPATHCMHRVPGLVDTTYDFAAMCGTAGVRFNIGPNTVNYFRNGSRYGSESLNNVETLTGGGNPSVAAYIYTGYNWFIYGNNNMGFSSTYPYNYYNWCNGVADGSAPTKLMYRQQIPVDHFTVELPPSAAPGTAFNFNVTARSRDARVAGSYAGTVHFTSTDSGGAVALPADTVGSPQMQFSATLATLGTQSITVSEGTIAGSDTVAVTAGTGTQANPGTSCQSILNAGDSYGDGTYWITTAGNTYPVYCDMTTSGGGWTLTMKIIPVSGSFYYSSGYWTGGYTLNTSAADTSQVDAQFESFNSVPLSEVMLLVDSPINSGTRRSVILPMVSPNLKAVFNGGEQLTSVGRTGWKTLYGSQSSLQPDCNKEGFNLESTGDWIWTEKVRLGIIGSNSPDCTQSSSRIGVGGQGYGLQGCYTYWQHSSGVTTRCGGDNGDVDVNAFSWIYIR